MRQSIAPSVRAGITPPWWLEEAGLLDAPPAPQLSGEAGVDVAVVGGGYTGLWTALALRERDPDLTVAVVERSRCGEGPGARNGGFLHGYWSSIAWLRQVLPDDRALELARAGDRIIPAVEAFVRGCGGDAWLRRGGLLKVATTPAQEASIDAAVTAAESLGAPDEALSLVGDELAERCGPPLFRRGILFRDGATVQHRPAGQAVETGCPRRSRDGPSRANARPPPAARQPERRHNSTRAAASPFGRGRRQLRRSRLAAHGEPPDELRQLRRADRARTGADRGARLDARRGDHGRPHVPPLLPRDARRPRADGEWLGADRTGGRLDSRFTNDAASAARAEAGLRRLLPSFAGVRLTHAWGGPIDVSSDRLPFVRTVPGTRIHYAAGFSGNGVGPSWLAAQALASLVTGREDEWTALPLVERRRHRLPPEPLKRLGGGLVRAAALAVEEADDAGRRAPPGARTIASLPRLLGVRLGLR